ncbi:hypothetical protein [Agrococcus sp. DT81.2]|uniref:hypothetical protein n=1 Tax=Agrococcus sp. DT81.2 TaxID=3393414 RepID=UPI003CE454FD
MAESIVGPLRITGTPVDRQTVLTASSVRIGLQRRTEGPVTDGVDAMAAAGSSVMPTADVTLDIGDDGASGGLRVRDSNGQTVVSINGETGIGTFGTGRGQSGGLVIRAAANGPVIQVDGATGRISFLNARLETTLVINGVTGDIEFSGADCSEDFDAVRHLQPGSVLVARADGLVDACTIAYDHRVVGVRSGAGAYHPALRLDSHAEHQDRVPIAIAGKAECLVDADICPVRVGDLLTTSPTPGHAMAAEDRARMIGATIGKSLLARSGGRGLIPMLVGLG